MDVRLPDGTVIKGVPDGMSKADLTAKLAANGYDVSKLGAEPAPESFMQQAGNVAANIGAGAVRGAGSIGATLLTPIDAIRRIPGVSDFLSMVSPLGVLGGPPPADRRKEMDKALASLGADTGSLAFKGGKIGAEIAGTLGVGGGMANAMRSLPIAAKVPGFVGAVESAGMTAPNMLTRMAGGATTGAAAAGLVNPEDAGMGAKIGGALPPVTKLAGLLGKGIGGVINGPAVPSDMVSAIKAARQQGYVIPPTQAKPTLLNRGLEGLSGKITTAQNASSKNQDVTAKLINNALGLPTGTKVTPDVLDSVRKAAGQSYSAVSGTGVIKPGAAYSAALDAIEGPHLTAAAGFPNAKASPVIDLVESLRSPQFDASSAVAKIGELRSAADDAFRAGNTDIGRASKAAARALEDVIDDHLSKIGNTQALANFRESRKLIAKTYSVQKALNPETGAIDARKLGAQLKAGKPLSGELESAARFALRFPKAAQETAAMGSLPQTSPLDWALGGGLAMGTGNPLMLASTVVRPAARAAILSPMVQDRLASQPMHGLQGLLANNPEALSLLYRASPVGLAGGR